MAKKDKKPKSYNDIIGHRESTDNYKAINNIGYVGRYQMGNATLQDLGYTNPKPKGVSQKEWLQNPKAWKGKDGIKSLNNFLDNPGVQDKAQDRWNNIIDKRLANMGIDKFIGKEIDGVKLTKEGARAAAHLIGPTGLIRGLRSGKLSEMKDAYGTKPVQYMQMFDGNKTSPIAMNNTPQESIDIDSFNVPQMPFMGTAMAGELPKRKDPYETFKDLKNQGYTKEQIKNSHNSLINPPSGKGTKHYSPGGQNILPLDGEMEAALNSAFDPSYEERNITKEQAEQRYGVNPPVMSEAEAKDAYLKETAKETMVTPEAPNNNLRTPTSRTASDRTQKPVREARKFPQQNTPAKASEPTQEVPPMQINSPFGTEKIGPSPSSVPNPFANTPMANVAPAPTTVTKAPVANPVVAGRPARDLTPTGPRTAEPRTSRDGSVVAGSGPWKGTAYKVAQDIQKEKENMATPTDVALSQLGSGGIFNPMVLVNEGVKKLATFGDEKDAALMEALKTENLVKTDLLHSQESIKASHDRWWANTVPNLYNQGYTKEQISQELEKQKGMIGVPAYLAAKEAVASLDPKPSYEKVSDSQIETIKKTNENLANGATDVDANGNKIVPNKAMPSEEDLLLKKISDGAGKLNAQANVPTNWYESDSFNSALISFGLNLLSGKGYADSFAAASAVYDKEYGREKRKSYFDELVADGYKAYDVDQWILDPSYKLSKPKPVETFTEEPMLIGDKYVQQNLLTKEYVDIAGIPKGYVNDGKGNLVKEGSTGSGKGPTEGQGKAKAMAGRSEQALTKFNELFEAAEKEHGDAWFGLKPEFYTQAQADSIGQGAEGFGGALINRFTQANNPALAAYRLNAMNALMPLMRDDSGATIGLAEEMKEFAAMIPVPGDREAGIYDQKMDSLMYRIAETYAKHPEAAYFGDVNAAVLRGRAKYVPTESGMVVADLETGEFYYPKEYASQVLGVL